jgi:hypothetical protein
MGGQSSSTQTQQSQTAPWQAAQPMLQGILGQIGAGLNNTGLTSAETGALNTLQSNAAQGNPYAGQISDYAQSLLNQALAVMAMTIAGEYRLARDLQLNGAAKTARLVGGEAGFLFFAGRHQVVVFRLLRHEVRGEIAFDTEFAALGPHGVQRRASEFGPHAVSAQFRRHLGVHERDRFGRLAVGDDGRRSCDIEFEPVGPRGRANARSCALLSPYRRGQAMPQALPVPAGTRSGRRSGSNGRRTCARPGDSVPCAPAWCCRPTIRRGYGSGCLRP